MDSPGVDTMDLRGEAQPTPMVSLASFQPTTSIPPVDPTDSEISSTLDTHGSRATENHLDTPTLLAVTAPDVSMATATPVGRVVRPPRPYPRKTAEEVLQPLYILTDTQEDALTELQAKIGRASDPYCDRACLVRFLRARDWKVPAAEKLLSESLAWRQSFAVTAIDPRTLDKESSTGKIYLHGHDRSGRPVMYQKPRNQNSKDYVLQVQQVAYFLEREMNCMDLSRGVEQHVLLIDFKGYSIFNAPPMSQAKEVLHILMNQYPERLGNAFMVDAPFLFNALWSMVKPFLPQATRDKIHFVSRRGKHGARGTMDAALAAVFDDEQLEEEYGGLLPSTYDHSVYWSEEMAIWEQHHKK